MVFRHARRPVGKTGISETSAKTIGVTGETLFAFRALEQGLVPSVPMGDNSQYDFLIDNGSKISRVQIKASSHPDNSSKVDRYNFTLKHSNYSLYSAEDIDVFGLVVIPLRLVYIVPHTVVSDLTKTSVFPTNNSTSKMEEFRERWDLL